LLLLSLPLALLTTFAFGVMPAFRASRFAVKRQHGSAVSGGRLPDALIAVQVTLAVVLLATAALFVRTLHNYATAAAQLRTESVVLFTGEADPSDIRHRILDLPGVISASHVRIPPFADASWTGDPVLEGYSPKPGENISVSLNEAGPGYFAVLGTGIVEGREFTESDRVGTRRVAVVNRAFARRYSEGRSVVGRFLAWGNDRRFEIVGVAADAPQESLRTPPQPTVFFAALQGDGSRRPSWTTVVRTSGTAAPVIHGVRQMLGPDRVLDVRTSQDQVDRKLIRERLLALFASTLGVVATALTALGIHALLAFRVARRRAEIGIRMALGASPLKAAAMILGALLPPVAAGVVIGIGGALACAHLLRSLLFGFAPEDPPTYAAAALVAVGVAAAGGALAAARAASIDPAVALRCE
jgi:putative ABC transport system permease protein